MKIALLTGDSRELLKDYSRTAPDFGTAPQALLEGFSGLPDVEVHVLSCTQRQMRSPDKLAPNIFFHSLCVPKWGWLRTGYQGCVRAVRRKLRAIQPQIVHGQGTERDCALSAVFSGFPNVITIHGNMAELARLFRARVGTYGWLAARLENFALKRTAGVFCNSQYTERLVKPRARRVWRVPNAIREQFFLPPFESRRPARCTLLNVGHPGPRKRQLELLDVVSDLRRQGLSLELQFVGDFRADHPYAAALLERIKPLEREGIVRCLGLKLAGELVKTFDDAAAMIHFPMEESFGLVVAEALARDLKFFGARVGGIADIAGGVPGAELFAVDDWRGLTSAIAEWIRSGFPRALGAAEVMRARYHPEVIAKRHLEIYREVLAESKTC
jgi:glycosyltransferase involved in cell wall biosynthesis